MNHSNKVFYSHLIEINEIHDHLDELDLQKQEYEELTNLIHDTIHHEVIHLILSNLPKKHHALFLTQIQKRPHDRGLMVFVKRSIAGIEDKIRQTVAIVKHEVLDEIEDYKLAAREWMEG